MLAYNNSYDAKEELELLPRNYPLELAIKNNDVVIYDSGFATHNLDRFYKFLDNLEKGIEDKIRIAWYGIDGYPTTSILEFNGNIIKYTIDATRDGISKKPYIYYGYSIQEKEGSFYTYLVKNFFLLQVDGKKKSIFSYVYGKR